MSCGEITPDNGANRQRLDKNVVALQPIATIIHLNTATRATKTT